MNKNWDINTKLYFYYKPLLSKRQQDYFEASYYDDLSISEIADMYGVSRTAVHDAIIKAETKLQEYENALKLAWKAQQRQKLYQEIELPDLKKKLLELEE